MRMRNARFFLGGEGWRREGRGIMDINQQLVEINWVELANEIIIS
jgi:hypothetical protein